MSSEAYASTPLNRRHNDFRLLQVSHGSAGENTCIRCLVKTFSLDAAPDFAALSYTWGPSTPTQPVSVNGHVLDARQNLVQVLAMLVSKEKKACLVERSGEAFEQLREEEKSVSRYVRPAGDTAPTHSSWYWIDALCIDQGNIQERGHQVSLMADIYSKAASVLVWLGPRPFAKDAVRHILKRAKKHSQNDLVASFIDPYWGERDGFRQSKTGTSNNPLAELMNREYWTRVWIVQEFSLAGHIVLTDGTTFFPGLYLLLAVVSTDGTEFNPAFRVLQRRFRHKNPLASPMVEQNNLKSPLNELVIRFQNQQCADRRDIVYGLLGICTTDRPIAVDYGVSREEVFAAAIDSIGWCFDFDMAYTLWRMVNGHKASEVLLIDDEPFFLRGIINTSQSYLKFCALLCLNLQCQIHHSLTRDVVLRGLVTGRKTVCEKQSDTEAAGHASGSDQRYCSFEAEWNVPPVLEISDDDVWSHFDSIYHGFKETRAASGHNDAPAKMPESAPRRGKNILSRLFRG